MKVKALKSFAGTVAMYAGEVGEVDDKTAAVLISCGYAEKISEDDGGKKKKGKAAENSEE